MTALREFQKTRSKEYSGSYLEFFYQSWQPENALEVLIGAEGPLSLSSYPPFVMHSPWIRPTPDERLVGIPSIARWENERHGAAALSISHGHGLMGPTSDEKGTIEFNRLLDVYESMRVFGYERSHGDIDVQVLERNGDLRYRVVHGHHRVAAGVVLGHEHLPARPRMLVRREEVWVWPRSGLWAKAEALKYFDHLFDFDSRAWAEAHGLSTTDDR